jgi:hypothetical protein
VKTNECVVVPLVRVMTAFVVPTGGASAAATCAAAATTTAAPSSRDNQPENQYDGDREQGAPSSSHAQQKSDATDTRQCHFLSACQWPRKLSRLRGINVLGAEVATVTVAVAVGFVWLMVAVVGLKLQLQLLPAGIAEQDAALRLNVPLKPFIDVIVNVSVPEFPGADTLTTRIDSRQNEVRSGGGITPAACVDQIEGVHGAQTSRQIVEDASRPWAAYVGKLETIQKRGFEK